MVGWLASTWRLTSRLTEGHDVAVPGGHGSNCVAKLSLNLLEASVAERHNIALGIGHGGLAGIHLSSRVPRHLNETLVGHDGANHGECGKN
jgi:hypothetical protein